MLISFMRFWFQVLPQRKCTSTLFSGCLSKSADGVSDAAEASDCAKGVAEKYKARGNAFLQAYERLQGKKRHDQVLTWKSLQMYLVSSGWTNVSYGWLQSHFVIEGNEVKDINPQWGMASESESDAAALLPDRQMTMAEIGKLMGAFQEIKNLVTDLITTGTEIEKIDEEVRLLAIRLRGRSASKSFPEPVFSIKFRPNVQDNSKSKHAREEKEKEKIKLLAAKLFDEEGQKAKELEYRQARKEKYDMKKRTFSSLSEDGFITPTKRMRTETSRSSDDISTDSGTAHASSSSSSLVKLSDTSSSSLIVSLKRRRGDGDDGSPDGEIEEALGKKRGKQETLPIWKKLQIIEFYNSQPKGKKESATMEAYPQDVKASGQIGRWIKSAAKYKWQDIPMNVALVAKETLNIYRSWNQLADYASIPKKGRTHETAGMPDEVLMSFDRVLCSRICKSEGNTKALLKILISNMFQNYIIADSS